MRRIFFLLLTAICLTACDKGDDTSTITGYDRDQLNQSLYANQTGSGSGFTFTAAQSWTTQVADATRAAATWVTIDPPHGGAGTFTLSITLMPNLTGKDRTATIKIICGDTTITITVEQKGTTEEDDEPQPEVPSTAKVISRMDNFENGRAIGYVLLDYDAQGRLVDFRGYDTQDRLENRFEMIYSPGKVELKGSGEGIIRSVLMTLDASGRVVSDEQLLGGKPYKSPYTYNAAGYLTDYPGGVEMSVSDPSGPEGSSGPEEETVVRILMNHIVWNGANMATCYEDWVDGKYEAEIKYEYTGHKNDFSTVDLMMGGRMSALFVLNNGAFGKSTANLIRRETVISKYPDQSGVYEWSYKFDQTGRYLTEFTRSFTCPTQPYNNYSETYKITYK